MKKYEYIGDQEEFSLENPELCSYLYFPMANENGVMSSVTPDLSGDSKLNQNTFLMPPVSSENLHNDKSSRNIWCRVNKEDLWSLTGKSAAQQSNKFRDQKEATRLEAGYMNHKLIRTSQKLGIRAEITSFVPASGEKAELMKVELTNISEQEMDLQVITAIPIYARSADNIRDHRHVTALLHRIVTMASGVAVNPTMTFDERGHHRNEMVYGVFGGNGAERPIGYFPVLEDFIGEGGSLENPETLTHKTLQPVGAGKEFGGYEALGGLCFQEHKVQPGERISYIVVMGYGETAEQLERMSEGFLEPGRFEGALEDTKKYWQEKVNVVYGTASKDFDKWMRWVSFQPMLRRIYGCSFLPHHDYGKGGRGWRDLWQDCLALLIMNPEGVRGMLADNYCGVRMDGTNATIIGSGQGEFIADRNNITRVWMDHGVWPFLTTQLYIQQTGDWEILLEEQPYFKDMQVCRGEEKDLKWSMSEGQELKEDGGAVYRGSLLEHVLVQHLTAFYDVGEHNHIRMRGADWNDALDMAQERGESVAFTAMYAGNMQQLAQLLEVLLERDVREVFLAQGLEQLLDADQSVYDRPVQKQELLASYCNACRYRISGVKSKISVELLNGKLKDMSLWIKEHIKKTEWIHVKSGFGWYNGYYDNMGRAVEGDHGNTVRMMLTGQVFAIMSGTADEEQIKEIIRSADAFLYDGEAGGYRLNTDFHEVKMDLGRMFGFAYGHKENGAVFSHMATMFGYALYSRGMGKSGYKVLNSLYEHCSHFERSRIYPGVPEYIDAKGRGMYHYLTGAASWLLMTVVTQMFGIRGRMGDLEFRPQLVKEQFDECKEASLSLVFADRNIKVIYRNAGQLEPWEYQVGSIEMNDRSYNDAENLPCISRADILALSKDEQHLITVHLEEVLTPNT